MSRTVTTLVGLVLVAGLSGCGADNEGGRPGELSADGFREQAQAICKDGNAAIDQLAEDFDPSGPTREQLERVAPQVPPLLDEELDRLAALDPPTNLADEVDEMVASFRTVVRSMRAQGAEFFEREDDPFDAAYAQAEELGLDECAQ